MQEYKVMVLGPSGSGKTVFLGSMYHRLAIQEEDIGFFLGADFQQQLRLNAIFSQIANQKEEWPDATQYASIEKWDFTCNTRSAQGVYPAFRFTYFDYAGERLTKIRPEEILSDVFRKAIDEADVYLGLLDGHKVLELMLDDQGDDSLVDEFVRTDLSNLLCLMQNHKKPAHFIITKWDLLVSKYKFSQIRERLLEIPQFKAFVSSSKVGGASVRLIPVSSVGPSFVDFRENGRMRKRAGVLPRPFQVEMPLACVLIDRFQTRLTELEAEYSAKKRNMQFIRVKPNISTWKSLELWTKRTAYSFLKKFPELKLLFDLEEETFDKIKIFLEEGIAFLDMDIQERLQEAERRAAELNRQQKASLDAVEDEKTAIRHIVDCFLSLVAKLERQFPESVLSMPGYKSEPGSAWQATELREDSF